MKKFMAFILAAVLLFGLVGCGGSGETYELPWWGDFCYSDDAHKVLELKAEDAEYIVAILNGATWEDGPSRHKLEKDFIFNTHAQEIYYCSEHGTFDDLTNGRNITVSEEQRLAINEIVGAKSEENF